MLAPNTLLQNRYLIIRSIGHGGMGAVYLARDQRLGHTVALKETFFTEERMRRAFEREARLLAHLRHPALPKVTDHFDEDGGQFIVMEFISGDDLEILLAQRGEPFPFEQILGWADELLKALDYLHNQDPPILHRDIKPANLKLTPQGEIILLDFGLAKGTAGQPSSVMTSRSVFGFTPNFAPLEQIQGTGTGPRSDLYALAATIYYLMTGVIPPDALTRITEVANGQPDSLRQADEVNPQIPREIAELLMRTMAHNRDHRPASAVEMRTLLREACPTLSLMKASYVAAKTNGNSAKTDSEAKTVMPSTLIEAGPTQDVPAAVETAASSTMGSLTTKQPASQLETAAPDEEAALMAKPERRVRRMPWAIAGVTALVLMAVTFAFVSFSGSGKSAGTDKTAKLVTNDVSSTGVPLSNASLQAIAAPDDSQIITTLDASGVKTETRTFKSNSHVTKVVVTTRDGKQTAQVYSIVGEVRDLPQDRIATALEDTGDSLAAAVGFTGSFDEKGKGVVATKQDKRGALPPAKVPGQKVAAAGTKTASSPPTKSGAIYPNAGSSTKPDSNEPILKQIPGATNVEQKKSQGVEGPKERLVKGIQTKGTPQPRAN